VIASAVRSHFETRETVSAGENVEFSIDLGAAIGSEQVLDWAVEPVTEQREYDSRNPSMIRLLEKRLQR
jgi:hypothetical protein